MGKDIVVIVMYLHMILQIDNPQHDIKSPLQDTGGGKMGNSRKISWIRLKKVGAFLNDILCMSDVFICHITPTNNMKAYNGKNSSTYPWTALTNWAIADAYNKDPDRNATTLNTVST